MSDLSHIPTITQVYDPPVTPKPKKLIGWSMFGMDPSKPINLCIHFWRVKECIYCNPKEIIAPITSKDCPTITDCSGSVMSSLLQKSDKPGDPCVFTADEISDRVRELTLSPGIN